MRAIKYLVFLILLVFAVSSCNKENESPIKKTPGYFVLAELNNPQNTTLKSVKSTSSSGFNFGDLKASKEFFFLLVNGGDEPVFDIRLSTGSSLFNILPSRVDQLQGETLIKNAENTGLIPILTLGITHGVNLNGVGFADLLSAGNNTSVLTITGKTLDNGDTIDIISNFDISVNAKVMDIEIFEGRNKIDITKSVISGSSSLGGLGFLRAYSVYDTSTISVKNIGNVDIDLYYGDTSSQNNHVLIAPADSVSIYLSDFISVLALDSKGTITDNSRIQLGDDGKGYLMIIKDQHESAPY